VGPRVGPNGCGKFRPHWDSTPTVQSVVNRYTAYPIPAPKIDGTVVH